MKIRLRLPNRILSLAGQVRDRPSLALFVTADLMPELHQLTGETAQKVRISVVPIGDPGMSKDAKAEPPVHPTLACEQTS